jgi:hypothetical protein
MFGKARELNDIAHGEGSTIEDFFGDESAAAEVARVDVLHHRITQVELQITSQFTSLATYAQIAQEQVELARAEAKASTERSEQRLTALIERERADRLEAAESGDSAGTVVSIGSARSAMDDRLDALERSVAQVIVTLDGCFAQQLALAEAIDKLFQQQHGPHAPAALPPPVVADIVDDATMEWNTLAPPRVHVDQFVPPLTAPRAVGPIAGLSLRLDIA